MAGNSKNKKSIFYLKFKHDPGQLNFIDSISKNKSNFVVFIKTKGGSI